MTHSNSVIQMCHCQSVFFFILRLTVNQLGMAAETEPKLIGIHALSRALNFVFCFSSPQAVAVCQRTLEQDKILLPSPTRSTTESSVL